MTPHIKEYRVVIDANVLAKIRVADLLLIIAEHTDLYEPVWSAAILDEVERTHRHKLGWPESALRKFRASLEREFPHAMIRGYERWIARCTNDVGDRHVLACAIEAGARVILTYNEKHFKPEHLAPWGLRQMTPDDYLLGLYARSPDSVEDQVLGVARKNGEIPQQTLERLVEFAPHFAATLLAQFR